MATLALAAVGAAVGSALLPAGITVLGATIAGATIGSQVGALAGSVVDRALLAGSGSTAPVHGPRLDELRITASTEGAPIPRVFGRARLGGQVIWAAPLIEETVTDRSGGSKGGWLGGSSVTGVSYRYFATFAVAVSAGPVTSIGRIWADGRELDLADLEFRIHHGTDDQSPDPAVLAVLGADDTPAFRDIAYVVFERLPLAEFGNRIPQLNFEVHRTVDSFQEQLRGVVMIPGSGEFAYSTTPVDRVSGYGQSTTENVHTRRGSTDWTVALDQLEESFPNVGSVSLVVSWFGTDLRLGQCRLEPRVDGAEKITDPLHWSVAGLERAAAGMVSLVDGRPAYGGTPSDNSVVEAIQDLRGRGLSVVFAPFVLMDIPAGNGLPDPYGAAGEQLSYPWRGRITCHPAPGLPGSPDKSAAMVAEVAAFVGTAAPADFAIVDGAVTYSGPAEWSFRRMILHNAHLCKSAGGVDAFVLCSELRGLTTLRSSTSSYPFVVELATLANEVKTILGPMTKILYSADWSEYFGHGPDDGSNDLHFHLDPLWASPDIDAVGIDLYWPLTDWRDGRDHLDWQAGIRSPYDLDHLKASIFGGEGHDWYYADGSDRQMQIRTAITDGLGKPWVFRYKDIRGWWSNHHHDRPGGVENSTPTAWVPQSKPFWILELGCPAVDKGTNQPNVFVDPKSSESSFPYFSRATRDDLAQRRFLQAFHEAWDPASAGYVADYNPVSTVYADRMIDVARMHAYAWDARPHPAFPDAAGTWGDAANWQRGHWLNGRIAGVPLASVVAAILEEQGFTRYDTTRLHGVVAGYVVDRIMSARDALEPLSIAYFFDAIEVGDAIVFRHRGAEDPVDAFTPDQLVEARSGVGLYRLTRAQESELPAAAKIAFVDPDNEHRRAVVEARRLAGTAARIATAELPLVLDSDRAAALADTWLFETWTARERLSMTVPLSHLALDPGDVIRLITADQPERLFKVQRIVERDTRAIEAVLIDPDIYAPSLAPRRATTWTTPSPETGTELLLLDLPNLPGRAVSATGAHAAAFRDPWVGPVALYRSTDTSGFELATLIEAPAIVGELLEDLASGPEGRWDHAAAVQVRLSDGELASVSDLALLAGRNLAAVESASGAWEVLQFAAATLVSSKTYRLERLLRGQGGSEPAMAASIPAGARFILLDSAVVPIDLAPDLLDIPLQWRWGPAHRNLGSRAYSTREYAFIGQSLVPLSPVHMRAERDGAGNATLHWFRRTRVDGDSWNPRDIPLGEASEAYEVDILSGAVSLRTLAIAEPSLTYTAIDQTADFGGPQAALAVRVHQLGARGRGHGRTAIV